MDKEIIESYKIQHYQVGVNGKIPKKWVFSNHDNIAAAGNKYNYDFNIKGYHDKEDAYKAVVAIRLDPDNSKERFRVVFVRTTIEMEVCNA